MNDFINSVINNDFVNAAISYVTDTFMSIFILGVLTGWLIEWIFYNLFWKQRGNKNITGNKTEAQSSNKIVTNNKEFKKEQQPKKMNEVEKKQGVNQAGEANQQEAKSKDDSTESKVAKGDEKQVAKQDAEEPEKDQATESKDEAVEPKAEATEKKALQKVAENPPKKGKKPSKPTKADDFTKLYGVGPSIAKSLKAIGVDSFKQLSESNYDELVKKLIANGTKVVNKGAMESWAEQAKLADVDDLDGLKAFQDELKKG